MTVSISNSKIILSAYPLPLEVKQLTRPNMSKTNF